jgi:Phage derived protein Gp49-like (DUF891)
MAEQPGRRSMGAGTLPPGLAGVPLHLDLLECRGVHLDDPYTRQLVGKLRELRFYCSGERIRITYWIAPGRRIIALTVFTKTRMRESAEVGRAERALARCQREGHSPDEDEDERNQR